MNLKVLAQPYRESEAAGQTFITHALEDPGVTSLLIVTAWVRESGLALLVPGLEALRQRGGTASLLFGVDLQGTSRDGVALARLHFTELHAVHDPSGRTFHPKMYLALGNNVGYALLGSNNLTAGGLWFNYETAVTAMFDPRSNPEISHGIRGYAQRLLDDKAICKRVTQRVFGRLVAEGWLVDEATDRRRRSEDRLARGFRRAPRADQSLFAASQVEKRTRPAPVRTTGASRPISSATRRRLATASDSWWKPLGAGDAQRPSVGNPTGNVALTHAPRDQNRETFFRQVFFSAESWQRREDEGGTTELAEITTEVEIGDDQIGTSGLTLVYRPYRRDRGRATTVLRWGDALLEVLRHRDVTGWYLLIERADIGFYRLRITAHEPS